MENADTLITNGLIVTMDHEMTTITDGSLAVRGQEIVAVGPASVVVERYAADTVIDAAGQIVMPGLINAHVHTPDSLFRGLVEDLPLERWLEKVFFAEQEFVRADTVELGSRLSMAEMISGGTTAALDMFWFPERSAKAAKEIGFRLMTGPIYFDSVDMEKRGLDGRLERGRAFIEEYVDDSLIVPVVQPHWQLTVSPEHMKEAKTLTDEYGILLHTHLCESAAEVSATKEQFGLTPPRLLDSLGMLGERSVLAHCIHLSDDEIELLADRGAVAVHNPISNMKLGDGLAPVPKMIEAGVPVLLGTDGPVSSNDLDMWKVMRFAGLVHRGLHEDPTLMPSRSVVKMATIDAARALGIGERTGSLEVGKQADIIMIDRDKLHLTPHYDVYSHLAYSVGRDDVSSVLVNGRVVMRDKELLTVDAGQIMAEANDLGAQIADYVSAGPSVEAGSDSPYSDM